MGLLAQCGYGRGQKIENGFDANVIQGVIMSPRDETRTRLEESIRAWRNSDEYGNLIVLFDPQFYASVLTNPRDGHLSDYSYYNENTGLGRTHFTRRNLARFSDQCIQYQSETLGDGLSYIVSPTIAIDDFRDYKSQITLDFHGESIGTYRQTNSSIPLLLSVIIDENAFRSLDATEEYLNELTTMDARGFYVVLQRPGNTLQNAIDPLVLAHFMYFCYVLSEINEYEVIVGYMDWPGFLLESVGVTYIANGWYQNLKQFSFSRFAPSSGGRRPRKRYSSLPLLSCPLINPELEDIAQAGRLNEVMSGSLWDHILTQNSFSPSSNENRWSDEASCYTHWHCLSQLSETINTETTLRDRISTAGRTIRQANALYTSLRSEGIEFEPSTGPDHLTNWGEAIRLFVNTANIS